MSEDSLKGEGIAPVRYEHAGESMAGGVRGASDVGDTGLATVNLKALLYLSNRKRFIVYINEKKVVLERPSYGEVFP